MMTKPFLCFSLLNDNCTVVNLMFFDFCVNLGGVDFCMCTVIVQHTLTTLH
jgi:hypothetical protein